MVVRKEEKFKDLSYIFVELLPKDCVDSSITSAQAEKEVIGGLFAGIKMDQFGKCDPDMFIGVQTNDNTVKFANLTDYNIISIKYLKNIRETFTFYKAAKEYQAHAKDVLVQIMDQLLLEKRVGADSVLINTDTYKDLPVNVADDMKKVLNMGFDVKNSKSIVRSPGAGIQREIGRAQGTGSKTYDNNGFGGTTYQAPKPKPSALIRTTKMPGTRNLGFMRAKVEAVMNGTYKTQIIRVLPKVDDKVIVMEPEFEIDDNVGGGVSEGGDDNFHDHNQIGHS